MCGIAAFSLASGGREDAHGLVRLCIAGLAERGEDACGWAVRNAAGSMAMHKSAVAPHVYLADPQWRVPRGATAGIVHVRDHTKGRPSIDANNHPIVHGSVCGVHNGRIQNDDELFRAHGRERAHAGMTVDSEAIFMLIDVLGGAPNLFDELIGSYTAAWMDAREPGMLSVVRGRGRPLFVGSGDGFVLIASTRHALQFVEQRLGTRLVIDSVPIETLLVLADGRISSSRPIAVRPFSESPTTVYDTHDPRATRARAMLDDDTVRTSA